MNNFDNGSSVLNPRHQFFWFSTAGYYGDGLNAIIVFAVCFMPESNQPNYRYIMDNLFKWVFVWIPSALWVNVEEPSLMLFSYCRYVIGTLELLVAENYMIVYLNGATSRKKMPTVGWLRKCYQQIDRRWVTVVMALKARRKSMVVFGLRFSHFALFLQVEEELEVVDNCSSFLVYSHPAGTHKTFHKVTNVSRH